MIARTGSPIPTCAVLSASFESDEVESEVESESDVRALDGAVDSYPPNTVNWVGGTADTSMLWWITDGSGEVGEETPRS